MSRDIHMHMEIKIRGKWEHYRHSKEPKDCRFHDHMMGRIESTSFTAPEDLTQITMLDLKYWVGDAHHINILGLGAIAEVEAWFQSVLEEAGHYNAKNLPFGYLLGNRWGSLVKYPDSFPFEIEDARIIYWFDN